MGDQAISRRHRVHKDGRGVTFERLDNAAVMLEIWVKHDDIEDPPYFRDVISSAEWVDTMAAMVVGDLEASASDLAALRDQLARLHERWRAHLIRAAQPPDEP